MGRTQRALHLQRMVVGTAAVRVQIGAIELRIGYNPVLGEQSRGYNDPSSKLGSTRHVESSIGLAQDCAAFHARATARSVEGIERGGNHGVVPISQVGSESCTLPQIFRASLGRAVHWRASAKAQS